MINFTVSIGNMINIIIIAAGLGICGMIVMQVSSGTRLRKEVSRYFQLFFGTVMLTSAVICSGSSWRVFREPAYTSRSRL